MNQNYFNSILANFKAQQGEKDFATKLYEYTAKLEYYLKTGEGNTQELVEFIPKNSLDLQTTITSVNYLYYFLSKIFIKDYFGTDKILHHSLISVEKLDTSFDILREIKKIFPKKEDTIIKFIISGNFNYTAGDNLGLGKRSIFGDLAGNHTLENMYVGFIKTLDFLKKDNIILSNENFNFLESAVLFTINNEEWLADSDERSLEEINLAKKTMGEIVYLYAYQVLAPKPMAIEKFKIKFEQEVGKSNAYFSIVQTFIEKANIDYFIPKNEQALENKKFKI